MSVAGFAGAYVLPDHVDADHILHLCAGSGSVPNVSMIKDALRRHPDLRHTFVYSNKTWQDVIFRSSLASLRRENPDRLRVIHTLTRESDISSEDEDARSGRVTLELLEGILEREPHSLIYACGPAVSVWENAHTRQPARPRRRVSSRRCRAFSRRLACPATAARLKRLGSWLPYFFNARKKNSSLAESATLIGPVCAPISIVLRAVEL